MHMKVMIHFPDCMHTEQCFLGPMNIYCLLITIFCPLVLNDPHKRAIYDCLGKEGLQEQGWEIVQRTRTPQEIREEYDRLAR